MRKLLSISLMALAIAILLPSCVSKKKFTELMSIKDSTMQTLAQTQSKVSELEKNVEGLESQVSDLSDQKNALESKTSNLSSELSAVKGNLAEAEKAAKEAEMKAEASITENEKMKAGVKGVFNPYQAGGLSLTQNKEQVVIAVPEGILFKSGSARLSKIQKESLQAVANTLAANPDLKLVIEGHADRMPLKEGAPWKNNWQLSMARANTVMKTLVKMGASAEQLSTVGKSNDVPVATVDMPTSESMAQNRRAELVVVANVGELFQLNQTL